MVSFEIVISSGTILTASATQNKDLWIALRGGNNNFGIVTKFTLKTFIQGKIWGGLITLPGSTYKENMVAMYNYNKHSGNGEDNFSTGISPCLRLSQIPS